MSDDALKDLVLDVRMLNGASADVLFHVYNANIRKSIHSQFRIPPIVAGSSEGMNAACAREVIEFAQRKQQHEHPVTHARGFPAFGHSFRRHNDETSTAPNQARIKGVMDAS